MFNKIYNLIMFNKIYNLIMFNKIYNLIMFNLEYVFPTSIEFLYNYYFNH